MSILRAIILSMAILPGIQVYSQPPQTVTATSNVVVDDGYDHTEMSDNNWGGSHGLFFGAKVQYSGTGDLWYPGNTVYAQPAGQYNYGAFAMGYSAHEGILSFYDGGRSTGAGNSITWNPVMSLTRGGNIGIGTRSPSDLLTINAGATRRGITILSDGNADAFSDLQFNIINTSSIQAGRAIHWVASHRKDGYFPGTPHGQSSLEFYSINEGGGYYAPLCFNYNGDVILASSKNATAGNVLVGKTSQSNTSYKLDVNGNIRANKIVVNTTGADFVFEEGYKLWQLEELQKYILQNKHLPDVPSAREMRTEGLDVGELNTKLLQKIEEMTLYIIAQNKKIQELEERMKNIETGK